MEILKNPLTWIITALGVLILGSKAGDAWSWIASLFPGKRSPANDLETAVKHFIAIRDYCKQCPEAQPVLDELWKCLPKQGGER